MRTITAHWPDADKYYWWGSAEAATLFATELWAQLAIPTEVVRLELPTPELLDGSLNFTRFTVTRIGGDPLALQDAFDINLTTAGFTYTIIPGILYEKNPDLLPKDT